MRLQSLPILIALSLAVLPAAAGMVLYRAWAAGTNDIAEERPAPIPAKVSPAWRCPHCGRIESKRKLGPDAADPLAPPSYEYAVSMANGSRRVFRDQSPSRWRVGERLIYIDGELVTPTPPVAGDMEY